METTNDILHEMRDRQKVRDIHHGVCGNVSLNSTKDYVDIIGDFADRIEAAVRAHPNFDDYVRLREELRATRERRDECEAKMYKAFERVTAAEERERKLKEEIRGLQDAMGDDTLLMQARDIDRANEEIKRLRGIVSRLFSKRHEEAIRQSEGSRAVIQSLKEKNERLLNIKEEYENAKRNITRLRREVTLKQGQMVDMGHAYRDELKRLKYQNGRLRGLVSKLFLRRHKSDDRSMSGALEAIAAIKEDNDKLFKALAPVLECKSDFIDADGAICFSAVREAKSIYNENNKKRK